MCTRGFFQTQRSTICILTCSTTPPRSMVFSTYRAWANVFTRFSATTAAIICTANCLGRVSTASSYSTSRRVLPTEGAWSRSAPPSAAFILRLLPVSKSVAIFLSIAERGLVQVEVQPATIWQTIADVSGSWGACLLLAVITCHLWEKVTDRGAPKIRDVLISAYSIEDADNPAGNSSANMQRSSKRPPPRDDVDAANPSFKTCVCAF